MSQQGSRTIRLGAVLLTLFGFAACGGSSARLLSLECLESCQDLTNPFLLTLSLEIDDPEQVLSDPQLHFRFGDTPELDLEHRPQFKGDKRLLASIDLPSTLVSSESRFTLFARAKDSQGLFTNEVSLDLQIER